MTVLIIGYPGSGKSRMAEDMAMEMSSPGERVYIAAMIPYGDDGLARIERHQKQRDGKGFETIEAPFDIAEAAGKAGAAGKTILLECLSNLAANELFERHTDPSAAAVRVADDVKRLQELARDLVIVSNHYEITDDFDGETVRYAEVLDELNDMIAEAADKTIRLEAHKV